MDASTALSNIVAEFKESQHQATLQAALCEHCGATPELIKHGHDGFLFENGAEGLANYMKHFLENPEDLKKMGKNSFATAKEKFTIDRYVDKMYAIFTDLFK